MKSGRRLLMSLMDFSNPSKGLETISTIAMATTILILICKTVINFILFDYVYLFIMGIWYYRIQEEYHDVPQHQVPAKIHFNNRKKKELKNISLVNKEVQKKKDSSRIEDKQLEQSLEKLTVETKSDGSEYTSGYLDLCKYFENEEHAVCEKKALLAYNLMDHGFCRDKAIDAAKNCDNLDTAITYLTQKCDSCNQYFSLPKILPMFMCTHKFCKSCAKNHFGKVIKERNILEWTCKICEMPKLESVEDAMLYLSNLDKDLESVLPKELCQKFKQEFKSGKWKTKLNSKESMLSNQHEKSDDWQTIPIKSSGKSSVQSTGAVTRFAARAAKNSSTANVTTTQFDKVFDRNDQISETTSSALSFSNHFTTKKVTSTPMGATNTTAGNNKSWPQTGTGLSMNPIDQSRVEDFYSNNNSSMEMCSFCCMKVNMTYKMISCEHKLCLTCASMSISQIIRNEDIINCACPFCNKPEFKSKEDFFKYFESFRKSFSDILNMEVQQLFESKFIAYVEKVYGDDECCTKSYGMDKFNEQDNCNQLQRNCNHENIPGSQVSLVKLLCEHSSCVDCLKEVISSENILELVCDICYQDNTDSKLEVLNNDEGINTRLKDAVGPAFYQIFRTSLIRIIAEKESASKFSLVNSSRNSVNEYVEKTQTTCPKCSVLCDLNHKPNVFILCGYCKTIFCETCKTWYNKGCEKRYCIQSGFHLHHKYFCYNKKKKLGFGNLELILKEHQRYPGKPLLSGCCQNISFLTYPAHPLTFYTPRVFTKKVDFVNVESKSFSCLLRDKYDCLRIPFKSELCKYHYEDYLANLILQNRYQNPTRWF